MQTLSNEDPMAKLRTMFVKHPAETGESYLEHLWFTIGMSSRFVVVGALLLTHGIFPFLFTRTASGRIEKIYSVMKERKLKTGNTADMYDI